MAHNHGSVYQVKVIHEDGTEELSEWIKQGDVAYTFCPVCRDVETAVSEYPLTDHLSPRSQPHDSSYLVLTGAKDSHDVPVSAVIPAAAEQRLPPSPIRDAAFLTEPIPAGSSAPGKLPPQKRTLRRAP